MGLTGQGRGVDCEVHCNPNLAVFPEKVLDFAGVAGHCEMPATSFCLFETSITI